MIRYIVAASAVAVWYAVRWFRAQEKNWRILAARVIELRESGIENVWLLCNFQGLAVVPGHENHKYLHGGYIAYFEQDHLHIEYAWHGLIAEYLVIDRDQVKLELCQIKLQPYDRWQWPDLRVEQPAILINQCEVPFIILGCNMTDAVAIKQAVRNWKYMLDSRLRDRFYESVTATTIQTKKSTFLLYW